MAACRPEPSFDLAECMPYVGKAQDLSSCAPRTQVWQYLQIVTWDPFDLSGPHQAGQTFEEATKHHLPYLTAL